MTNEIVHYASVNNSAVVQFPSSAYYFMKVYARDGHGAIVNLWTGELLFEQELERDNLGCYCKVVADSLDEFVREEGKKDTFYEVEDGDDVDDDEEWCDENCAECAYKTLCTGSPFKK